MSLICLFKIYAEINKSMDIDSYNKNEKIKEFFSNKRKNKKQDFRVDVKFGIHIGWAIESIIGSNFKMDATYLSPHLAITQHMLNAAFY